MSIINKVLSLKPELLFVFLSLFFGIISAIFVPQLSVNDEGAHLYRSYSISSGNITSAECYFPEKVIDKVQESYKGIYPSDAEISGSDSLDGHSCGSAGSYYPIMHLPQSLGIAFSKLISNSPSMMVLIGRIANLIFYTVAMYLIIRYAVVGKWAFFVIGLLPISIHTAASLSYDTFNTVAILAFISIILNLYLQKRPLSLKQISLLTLVSLFVATAKTSNIVLLLLVFILPTRLFKGIPTKYSATTNRILSTFGIVLVSCLSILVWQKIANVTPTELSTINRVNENPLYFVVILYNTYINPFFGYGDVVVRGVVGEFSSFKYHLPTFLVIGSYGLILFTLLSKKSYEKKYIDKNNLLAISFVLIYIISFMVITYGLYSMWATLPKRFGPDAIHADGVQGRYFTPLLALMIPMGISLRKYISIETSSEKVHNGIILASTTLLLLFYTYQTVQFMA